MNATKTITGALRWTARGIGGLILVFVFLHIFSEGVPDPRGIVFGDLLLWFGFVLCLTGFAMLWRWELYGGALALFGIVLFYTVHFVTAGSFPGGWVFPLFFMPGILAILCWIRTRRSMSTLQ